MANELQADLDNALKTLNTCINSGSAFVDRPNTPYVKTAMDAINDLDGKLNEVSEWIKHNH